MHMAPLAAFIRECNGRLITTTCHLGTQAMLADMGTKIHPESRFRFLNDRIMGRVFCPEVIGFRGVREDDLMAAKPRTWAEGLKSRRVIPAEIERRMDQVLYHWKRLIDLYETIPEPDQGLMKLWPGLNTSTLGTRDGIPGQGPVKDGPESNTSTLRIRDGTPTPKLQFEVEKQGRQ